MPIITTDKPLRERDPHDFYPTPIELATAIVNTISVADNPWVIIDPGAGTGVFGDACRIRWPKAAIAGVEIRPDAPKPDSYTLWKHANFLETTAAATGKAHLIIGNPPYGLKPDKEKGIKGDRDLAEHFVRHALSLTEYNGLVVFLLRLAFLEGDKRGNGLHKELRPFKVAILSQRPSFMPIGHKKAGKTDATAYAVFYWQKGFRAARTDLTWLSWKPKKVKTK